MSRKQTRVPGMAGPSFAIPRCSEHGTLAQKNDAGEWFCVECFDRWLNETALAGKSAGGVDLPTGVRDERRRSVRELMPNRRWRRHAR